MFEQLRNAIDKLLDSASQDGGAGAVGQMHDAVVEARAALTEMRRQIEKTERKLARERKQLADAERRGQLAADIRDTETVEIAKQFAEKHRERAGVLERKLDAQRAEVKLAEQELAHMSEQLKSVRRETLGSDAAARVESAWRDIENAGGVRPELDMKDELLRSAMDAAARDAAADEQLRQLKKKMGR